MKDNDLVSRIEDLEREIRKLKKIAYFKKEYIPIRYRKAFPEEDEDILIKSPVKYLPAIPPVFSLFGKEGGCCEIQMEREIRMPNDPEEYKKAAERLHERSEKHKKFMQESSAASST